MMYETQVAEEQAVLAFREDYSLYIKNILGCNTLEGFQSELCKTIAYHDRVRVDACHSVGKTFLMARIAHAFLNLYPYSKVITTAPTYRQVVTLLWGELNKAHKDAPVYLNGRINLSSLFIDHDWFALGFTPQHQASDSSSRQQKGSTFQGYHAPYILLIFDESTGVHRDVHVMAEGLMTSGEIVKWVQIGNPTTRSSEFFKTKGKPGWHTVKIDCFNSPNMIANGFNTVEDIEEEIEFLKILPDDETRLERYKSYEKPNPHLINAQWVIPKIYEWGFDHPLTKSKIFAEFPDSDDNAMITWDNIQKAFFRDIPDDFNTLMKPRYIGVDVARFGEDKTVITEIQGNKHKKIYISNKEDLIQTTGRVMHAIHNGTFKDEVPIHVIVDATGIGSGVVDNLKDNLRMGDLPNHVYIHEVHFAQAVPEISQAGSQKERDKENAELKKTFENLKSFMFTRLNLDLRNKLDLPEIEEYEEELPTILFTYSKKGRLMCESKEDYKARLGKSPDVSDSLALANLGPYLTIKVGKWTCQKNKKPDAFSYQPPSKKRKPRIKPKEY